MLMCPETLGGKQTELVNGLVFTVKNSNGQQAKQDFSFTDDQRNDIKIILPCRLGKITMSILVIEGEGTGI